jgi:cysteine desulfurase / selenocysteine lyase
MFDCIVVGAGIHGLCTAFWVCQRGGRRVAVLERHAPGHTLGSSHGDSRITRSCYHDAALVEAAERVHREGWPALERAAGRPLRVATPGVFCGPPAGPFGAYLAAAPAGPLEPLALAAARRRFPMLRFADGDAVLLDHTAAVVLAGDTMRMLRGWLAAHGVALRWQTPVVRLDADARGIAVVTTTEVLRARAVVLACGPWTGRLHAAGLPPLAVLPQHVGYVDANAPPDALAPGAFPVWARIGAGANDFVYGLPAVGGGGLKVARHCTDGIGIDPDLPPPPLQPGDGDALLALARARLALPLRALRATERCLYTMAPGQQLHVLRDPRLPLVTIAACSGHAFKFGPLIGRTAADAVAAIG